MQTRKGTKVLHEAAARQAIIAEVYHDADEYVCYRRFTVGTKYGTDEPRFAAEPPDHLLVYQSSDRPEWCYAINLVNGTAASLDWKDLADTVKPYNP
jgi:hypothetical protein